MYLYIYIHIYRYTNTWSEQVLIPEQLLGALPYFENKIKKYSIDLPLITQILRFHSEFLIKRGMIPDYVVIPIFR